MSGQNNWHHATQLRPEVKTKLISAHAELKPKTWEMQHETYEMLYLYVPASYTWNLKTWNLKFSEPQSGNLYSTTISFS